MKRSSGVVLAVLLSGLMLAVEATLQAEEPAKKAEAVKQPWQRYLQGANAEKAAQQEKKLTELQENGQFAEALKVAEALAELRSKLQGADHWQAVNAHFQVEAIRRVLNAKKEEQTSFSRAFARQREAAALNAKGHYREVQPLLEQVFTIRRQVLGEEHPDTVASYNNVAINLYDQGKYTEAEVRHRKALAIRRKVLGEEHPDTAQSYSNLAQNLNTLAKYAAAEEGNRKALAIRRNVLGEEHLDTAQSYNNLAQNLGAQGKYREAEEGYRKALAIFRKVLGEEHPDTAVIYHNAALNLKVQAKYREAEMGYRKALTIWRKTLGEEHPTTAIGYNNLATCLNAQAKHREAEEDLRKALAIRRKVLGEEHPDTATSYSNLAQNLSAQDKYREAEEGSRKALAIRRKVLGEEHPDTAASYNNVALHLEGQGKYREAEEGLRKALAIFRKVLGEEHPTTAAGYANVATDLSVQGKHSEAEEGLRKALAIRRKVLGEEHPATATSYNDLAKNLEARSKYREAEEGLQKALAIWRKVLGEEHPATAAGYNSVAMNLEAQGKYREAEEGLRKSLAIWRKVLGEERISTAIGYTNLAFNLHAQRKYGEAEEGFRKALAIFRKVLGEEHLHTARSYNNVAFNLSFQGKWREAEEGFRKALAIRRKVLGEEHPDMAQNYNNLAHSLFAQGNYREAEIFFLRAADSFDKARLHVAATGLDRASFTSESSPLVALAAILARNDKPDEAWRRFEEDLARGTWDDLSARLLRPQSERDRQAEIITGIDRLNKLIERVSVAEPTPEQSKQREEMLGRLRQAYDELAAFTEQLEKKYGPIAGQIFPRSRIQAALPADAAFLAWLDIVARPKAADPNGDHWAMLLRSTGSPVWVRLPGSGEKNAWTEDDTRLPAQLGAALRSAGSEWQPLAERLRKQRLDPLIPHLKGVRRLIVPPSTNLVDVPVEVIADGYTVSYAHSGTMFAHLLRQRAPTGEGLFALADPIFDSPAEKEKPYPLPPGGVLLTVVAPGSNAARAGLKPNDVLLSYGDTDLSKPDDLKLLPESNDPEKRVPLIVWRKGDKLPRPLFVLPGKLGVVIAREPAPQAVAELYRLDRRLASRNGDDGKWSRLPGTRFEAASLHRLFDKDSAVQLLLDSDASEQRLNELAQSGALGKYRYLHLATHGEVDNIFPLRSALILSRDHLPDDKQRTELLLSGQAIPDGRLTAEEALARWHLHCDLVTLSACQTALGKYERGEGFVGFAQALILCGTRSVCLSLWKVDDTATALLMERFYQNLLGKRGGLKSPMPKAAALAEAKTWLRTLPRAQALQRAASLSAGVPRGSHRKLSPLEVPPAGKTPERNEDCPYAHPYFWAAFVLCGDPQ